MEYVTLSNGVKMPILGYGVYQVTKDECERCVLDMVLRPKRNRYGWIWFMLFCNRYGENRTTLFR